MSRTDLLHGLLKAETILNLPCDIAQNLLGQSGDKSMWTIFVRCRGGELVISGQVRRAVDVEAHHRVVSVCVDPYGRDRVRRAWTTHGEGLLLDIGLVCYVHGCSSPTRGSHMVPQRAFRLSRPGWRLPS